MEKSYAIKRGVFSFISFIYCFIILHNIYITKIKKGDVKNMQRKRLFLILFIIIVICLVSFSVLFIFNLSSTNEVELQKSTDVPIVNVDSATPDEYSFENTQLSAETESESESETETETETVTKNETTTKKEKNKKSKKNNKKKNKTKNKKQVNKKKKSTKKNSTSKNTSQTQNDYEDYNNYNDNYYVEPDYSNSSSAATPQPQQHFVDDSEHFDDDW